MDDFRAYEATNDLCVLPDLFIVVRLDGRGFTRLTSDATRWTKPFDLQFRALMIETAGHLMRDAGVDVTLACTHSDEISLVFPPRSDAFGRRLRKLNSILAAEASAAFSLSLGERAVFDARVVQLPSAQHVRGYLRWRQRDAHRNALLGHCYWALRREGLSGTAATQQLAGRSVSEKNELLFARGINFNDLPAWQKRGVALYWTTYEVEGVDPRTQETTTTTRRRLGTRLELPSGAELDAWLRTFPTLSSAEHLSAAGVADAQPRAGTPTPTT